MEIKQEHKGYILVLFAIIIWSFGEIAIKLVQQSIGPFSYSFLRFFIGALFLFSIIILKKDYSGMGKIVKENKVLLAISCSALGISNILYFIGISNTQANTGSVIYTTYPIWVMIFSIMILRERTNLKIKFIGMIIGLIGVAILMTNFNFVGFFSSGNLFGNLIALISSMMWSLYSVIGKKIQTKEQKIPNSDLKFTMISFLLAIIPIFSVLIFTPEFKTFLIFDLYTWLFMIIFFGIISSGLAYYLFFKGVEKIEITKGISLALLKPIIATIFAFIILGEEITLILLISTCLVIISLLLINNNSSKKIQK